MALAVGHLTLAVKGHLCQTDGLGVGARLHHAGFADAIRIGHQLGVIAGVAPADIAKIAEQAVGVAADDGIEAVYLGGQCQIPLVADVGERHDLVDPLGLQHVDRGLSRGDLLAKAQLADVGGDIAHVFQHQTDDGDQLFALRQVVEIGDRALLVAVKGVDHEGLEVVSLAEGRIGLGVEVGGQHREVDPLDEAGQLLVIQIELVVAQRHGIEAELAQQLGVGHPLVEFEVATALPGIAAVQQQQGLVLGQRIGLIGFRHGQQARITAKAGIEGVRLPLRGKDLPFDLGIDRIKLGVGVVHVSQGQHEGRVLFGGLTGEQGGGKGREQEGTQAIHG